MSKHYCHLQACMCVCVIVFNVHCWWGCRTNLCVMYRGVERVRKMNEKHFLCLICKWWITFCISIAIRAVAMHIIINALLCILEFIRRIFICIILMILLRDFMIQWVSERKDEKNYWFLFWWKILIFFLLFLGEFKDD